MVDFKIDSERIMRVATAIGRGTGDISDVLMPDLKHTCELLARVSILQDLAPGFIDEMFHTMIPHFIKMQNKANLGAVAQSKADASGFGNEWREAIEAGNSAKQKDFLAKVVAMHMKANGVTQAEAIKAIAEQTGRDPDDVRRVVTRSKKRNVNS